jgi:hypothetical protein
MLVSVTLALLAASAAPADAAVPAVAAAPAVKEKKVCVTEQVTGSIMPRRICRTRAEADARSDENGRSAGDQQRTIMTRPTNRD